MTNINKPAFPLHPAIQCDGPPTDWHGMTLRDWFAGQALVAMGLWAPYHEDGTAVYGPAEVQRIRAQYAYNTADAMLEARKAKP